MDEFREYILDIDEVRVHIKQCEKRHGHSNLLERFHAVYAYMKRNFDVLLTPQYQKSDIKAICFRMEGNRLFDKECYAKALEYYTASIAFAETKKIMSLGFANRALIFSKWSKTAECSTELDRATLFTDDDVMKCELASKKLDVSKLHPIVEEHHDPTPFISPELSREFIEISCNNIELRTDEIFGNYIVATQTINIGDILLIEKPLVATLVEGNLQHCHECFQLCYNPIPCDFCTDTLYCNENCKAIAQSYHRYVCVVKRRLTGHTQIFGESLAVKLTILMRIDPSRYREVFNMQQHLKRIDDDDLLLIWLSRCVLIYHILKTCTDYFHHIPDRHHAEEFFKESLISNWAAVYWNSSSMIEMSKSRENMFVPEIIGFGLFSMARFFNHSCCPNVIRVFYGPATVLRALRTIGAGQQCFISYGCTYENMPRIQRTAELNCHHFTCACRACVENWPLYSEMVDQEDVSLPVAFGAQLSSICDLDGCRRDWPFFANYVMPTEKKAPCPEFYVAVVATEFCLRALGNRRSN